MSESEHEKLKGLTSSYRKPEWAKPWPWMAGEFARLRAWFRYIRDEEPEYLKTVATAALETDHWPHEIHKCAACDFPAPRGQMLCVHCQAEEEDYQDEQEMYRSMAM